MDRHRRYPPLSRISLPGWLVTLTLVTTSTAQAQETVAVPSAQDQLLLEAGSAAREGDLATAEARYRAALQIGDLNIAYLGLARISQRRGDCQVAGELFTQALVAPAAGAPYPGPAELQQVIDRYKRDNATLCRGVVKIECASTYEQIEITIGDAPVACGGTLERAPGTHQVRARGGERSVAVQVTVTGLETVTARVELPPAQAQAELPAPAPDTPGPSTEAPTGGWWLVGAGGALLVTTGGLYLAQRSNDESIEKRAAMGIGDDDAAREARRLTDTGDRLQIGQWVTGTLGLATLVTGVALLSFQETEAPTAVLSLWGPNTVGVVWTEVWP